MSVYYNSGNGQNRTISYASSQVKSSPHLAANLQLLLGVVHPSLSSFWPLAVRNNHRLIGLPLLLLPVLTVFLVVVPLVPLFPFFMLK